MDTHTPVALTIAGSDSGAGAGIQADLLTFAANGVYGTTAITCLTAQNPDGVTGIRAMEPEFVTEQILQVHRYFAPRAIKTGMLYSEEIITAVAAFLAAHREIPAVIDPVMVATSGAALLKISAIETAKLSLLPLAALVTPNLDEVAVLLGRRPTTESEMIAAGTELAVQYQVPFLIKGGHLGGDSLTDLLVWPSGEHRIFHGHRIGGVNTHGSGCTLAAAIAAHLARGHSLSDSVEQARLYLLRGMRTATSLRGGRFINHLP